MPRNYTGLVVLKNKLRKMSVSLPISVLILLLIGAILLAGCSPAGEAETGQELADKIWADTVPVEGTATIYGLRLSLVNTQQFIGWYDSLELSEAQENIKATALDTLAAPCCDEFTARTC